MAVTKTVPLDSVRAAFELGVTDFGENHATELSAKAQAVPATWHFLGKLQAGTAAKVADHAAVIHSGEPGRALERVARRAERAGRAIRCLLQVDFTGRRQGVAPEQAEAAVQRIADLGGIRLTGLMTLPPLTDDLETTRGFFRRLRELRDRLAATRPWMVDLSMGMSEDYEAAVEEGATMVRVGTALFGARPGGPRARSDPRMRGGT